MDLQDYIDDAREEGIREGRKEGRAEERANTEKEKSLREAAEAEILKLKAQLTALQNKVLD